jgi:hypothetical protein
VELAGTDAGLLRHAPDRRIWEVGIPLPSKNGGDEPHELRWKVELTLIAE